MNIKNILMFYILVVITFFQSCQQIENQKNQEKATNDIEDEKINDSINKQLIIVLTKDSIDTKGYLFRYELINSEWKKVDKMIDVTIGKNGIANGIGLDVGFKTKGQDKIEGDGKSPSGVFTIGDAFGFLSTDIVKGIKLNYHHIDSFSRCIEDDRSKYYNHIVQLDRVDKDWEYADKMRNVDLYEWGFFVNHNSLQVKNAGSCVFFHIWRAPGKYTLGCTAMSKNNIQDLLYWIDPIKKPLIIQYAISDYEILRKSMEFPDIDLP